MARLFGPAFFALLLAVMPHSDKFAKYHSIEAYEIRPGILMMPRYSQDGQVCEIGLQTRHYSPEIVRLDSSLSRSEINGLFDELVPADERGRKSEAFGSEMTTMDGPGLTTIIQYENVWFEIVSERLPTSTQKVIRESDVVAIVHWKNRTCQ